MAPACNVHNQAVPLLCWWLCCFVGVRKSIRFCVSMSGRSLCKVVEFPPSSSLLLNDACQIMSELPLCSELQSWLCSVNRKMFSLLMRGDCLGFVCDEV